MTLWTEEIISPYMRSGVNKNSEILTTSDYLLAIDINYTFPNTDVSLLIHKCKLYMIKRLDWCLYFIEYSGYKHIAPLWQKVHISGATLLEHSKISTFTT